MSINKVFAISTLLLILSPISVYVVGNPIISEVEAEANAAEACGPFYCATDELGIWAHAGTDEEFRDTFTSGWEIEHTHDAEGGYENWHDWMGSGSMEESGHGHFNCEPPS